MKVLAIGGSTSDQSINRQLAYYAASLMPGADVMQYDFSNYDLPIYSQQREATDGIPSQAIDFAALIESTNLLVISLAEHNGSYSAGFKNLVDWTSRIRDRKVWGGKPMLLMATSPGGRGGATVLAAAELYYPFMGAVLKGTFSLPRFYDNFKDGAISNPEKNTELIELVRSISNP